MKQKEKKRISDFDSSGHLGVTEMFGAIFFMLMGGLKKDYNHYYQIEYQKRNILAGYFLGIFAFVLFILILVLIYN